jgi:hypothetical protein
MAVENVLIVNVEAEAVPLVFPIDDAAGIGQALIDKALIMPDGAAATIHATKAHRTIPDA